MHPYRSLPPPLLQPTMEKAKAKANRKLALVPDEQVLNWNKTQIEAEIGELKQDLALRTCTPLSTYALTY